MLDLLFSPLTIRGKVIKIRMGVPPMLMNYCEEDGTCTERYAAYMEEKAKGGFGLILTENVAITSVAKGYQWIPGLWKDAHIPGFRAMTEADWRPYDPGNEGLYHRLYQASRDACTVAEMLSAAKTKRYPLARLRRMVLSAYLQLPPAPERVPYLRVLAATAAGRAHLRCLRDAGAPVLTTPAGVPALGPAAEELVTRESRCTDLYVLARPDLPQSAPGQDYRTTPVMV